MQKSKDFLANFPGLQIFATASDKKHSSVQHYHADFDTALPYLKRDNDEKRAVYFTVNELDRTKEPKKKRTKKMVISCRAVWVEDDNAQDKPRTDWPIEPNLVVNTSPGKYHYYWLTATNDFDLWQRVMNRMVVDHGCDVQAKDLARILRLPGFLHQKKEPHLVTFEQKHDHFYQWSEITKAFPPLDKSEVKNLNQGGTTSGQSIREIIEQTKDGHTHGPSISMALSLANRGLKEDEILAILELMPEYSEGDHLHSVRTALQKVSEEKEEHKQDIEKQIESLPDDDEILNTPDFTWPPGLMGEMCQEAFEMAHYGFRGVSIVTCLGLVAGIIGRAYNVRGTGLNLYVSLLMDTGMGKDTVRKIIDRTLREINPIIGPRFLGTGRYTAPPAVWRDLQSGLSKVSVLTEAGLLNGSGSGDKENLRRVLLSLYGSSGQNDVQSAEGYSSMEKSLPELYAPALTLIQESTPKSFIDAMLKNDGVVSGDLGRMWLLKIDQDRPFLNRSPRQEFSEDIKDRIQSLLHHSADFLGGNASDGTPKNVTHIEVPQWCYEYCDKIDAMFNEARRRGDIYKKVMLTRAWLKSIKIAAIISIFNGKEKELDKDVYEWVWREVLEREITSIEKNIRASDSSDFDNVAINVVGQFIARILKKPHVVKLRKDMAMKGMFTVRALNEIAKNNLAIKEFASRKDIGEVKSGIEKILVYMVRNDLLYELDKEQIQYLIPGSRAKKAYRISDDFIALLKSKSKKVNLDD